ncbi:unnamed protein product [Agarophyton chilense]
MMAEDSPASGEVVADLATDSGEMIVDPPLSSNTTAETLSRRPSDATSTEVADAASAPDSAAIGVSDEALGGESFFTSQPGVMDMIEEDGDLDVGEIITPEPPAYWRNKAIIQEAQQKFKVHETDSGSPEFQIATLTKRIEYLTVHLKTHPKDFSSTRGLLKMVATRRKLLKYLKRDDPEKFTSIVSGLNIRISQKLRNL